MSRPDSIDGIREQWSVQRPDLDSSGVAITDRIFALAKHLDRRAVQVLEPLVLSPWAFDVLAALRRQGAPYRLTPTELSRATLLTSGAMTNRLDRLEAQGLVRREADPGDRRGVRVVLLAGGVDLVDRALALRFAESVEATAALSLAEGRTLESLLRRLLLEFEHERNT